MFFVGAEDQGEADDLGALVGGSGERGGDGVPAVEAEKLGGGMAAGAEGLAQGPVPSGELGEQEPQRAFGRVLAGQELGQPTGGGPSRRTATPGCSQSPAAGRPGPARWLPPRC